MKKLKTKGPGLSLDWSASFPAETISYWENLEGKRKGWWLWFSFKAKPLKAHIPTPLQNAKPKPSAWKTATVPAEIRRAERLSWCRPALICWVVWAESQKSLPTLLRWEEGKQQAETWLRAFCWPFQLAKRVDEVKQSPGKSCFLVVCWAEKAGGRCDTRSI